MPEGTTLVDRDRAATGEAGIDVVTVPDLRLTRAPAEQHGAAVTHAVEVDEPFVEGLVRVEYLTPDDFYDFDPATASLCGRHAGSVFALGDRVKVEILQVSVARRRIELRLVSTAKGKTSRGRGAKKVERKGKPGGKSKGERKERRKSIRAQNARGKKKR